MRTDYLPIPSYEHLYKINSCGDIQTIYGRPRKLQIGRSGYWQILLSNEGHKKCFLVHRLVAATFIRAMLPKEVVNHLNGIPLDNRLENLEITTYSGNMLHAYRVTKTMGLRRGAARSWTKLTEADVLEIRRLYADGIKQRKIAEQFNIDQGHVSAIVNRKQWGYL